MKLSSELTNKIIYNIYSNEGKLIEHIIGSEGGKYFDFEFDIDGNDVYVEVKIENIKCGERHYKATYPEPSEDCSYLSFTYEIANIWIGGDKASKEEIKQANEKLNGYVEDYNYEWK